MTIKETLHEAKLHHEDRKEARHERHEEKKFAHDLKHQMNAEKRAEEHLEYAEVKADYQEVKAAEKLDREMNHLEEKIAKKEAALLDPSDVEKAKEKAFNKFMDDASHFDKSVDKAETHREKAEEKFVNKESKLYGEE